MDDTANERARRWGALEPFLFIALVLLYIWVLKPTRNDLIRVPFLVLAGLIPITSHLRHRDPLPALGLRIDNLRSSAPEVGIATLAGALVVVLIGAAVGGLSRWPGAGMAFLTYPAWALVQQYLMQSFTYRRLRQGLAGPGTAAALTGLLFGLAHWPNTPLALVTALGGYVWCRLFERHPNLLTLALSHGWLAVLLRIAWPAEWLHNLRVGPSYWTWTP